MSFRWPSETWQGAAEAHAVFAHSESLARPRRASMAPLVLGPVAVVRSSRPWGRQVLEPIARAPVPVQPRPPPRVPLASRQPDVGGGSGQRPQRGATAELLVSPASGSGMRYCNRLPAALGPVPEHASRLALSSGRIKGCLRGGGAGLAAPRESTRDSWSVTVLRCSPSTAK